MTQSLASVAITGGLFTVTLNESGRFGAAAFAGEARFLEMAVQCPGDAALVTLPRQQLTATPTPLSTPTSTHPSTPPSTADTEKSFLPIVIK